MKDAQASLKGVRDEQSALHRQGEELQQAVVVNHKRLAENYRIENLAYRHAYQAECEYRVAVSRETIAQFDGIPREQFLAEVKSAANSKLNFALIIVGYLEGHLRYGGVDRESVVAVIAEDAKGRNCTLTEKQRERILAVLDARCPISPTTGGFLPPYAIDW